MRPQDTDLAKPATTLDEAREHCGVVPTEADYLEDLWHQERDKNTELCSALREVYALAGEVNGVKEIVERALKDHGGEAG